MFINFHGYSCKNLLVTWGIQETHLNRKPTHADYQWNPVWHKLKISTYWESLVSKTNIENYYC